MEHKICSYSISLNTNTLKRKFEPGFESHKTKNLQALGLKVSVIPLG